jgi:hypothetical protein
LLTTWFLVVCEVIYYESEKTEWGVSPSWIQCDMHMRHEGIEDLTFETTEIADSCPFSSKLVSLYAACTFSEKIILSSDPSFLFAEDSSSFCWRKTGVVVVMI